MMLNYDTLLFETAGIKQYVKMTCGPKICKFTLTTIHKWITLDWKLSHLDTEMRQEPEAHSRAHWCTHDKPETFVSINQSERTIVYD